MKILMTIMQKVQSVFRRADAIPYVEQQARPLLQPSSIEREEALNSKRKVIQPQFVPKAEIKSDSSMESIGELNAQPINQQQIEQQSTDEKIIQLANDASKESPVVESIELKVESQPMHKFEVANDESKAEQTEHSEQYAEERVKDSPLKKLLLNNLQIKRKRPLPIKEREDK